MPENDVRVNLSKVKQKEPIKDDAGWIDEYKKRLGSPIDLSDDQNERLVKILDRELKDYETNTSGLQTRLGYYNDLVEGIVEDTDEPFEGASNVHIPLTLIFMKV